MYSAGNSPSVSTSVRQLCTRNSSCGIFPNICAIWSGRIGVCVPIAGSTAFSRSPLCFHAYRVRSPARECSRLWSGGTANTFVRLPSFPRLSTSSSFSSFSERSVSVLPTEQNRLIRQTPLFLDPGCPILAGFLFFRLGWGTMSCSRPARVELQPVRLLHQFISQLVRYFVRLVLIQPMLSH